MNIRLAYDAFFDDFQSLFPEVKRFDNNDTADIDLLIFSGGEDVSLDFYMDADGVKLYEDICMCNKRRDEREKEIFLKAMSGKIKVNKILGVCRGLQFLNVMMSGNLFAHLGEYGIQHPNVHELTHIKKSPLNFMTIVNSLHHQAVRQIGGVVKDLGIQLKPYIIARDNVSGDVPEIVIWGDKILGVQFHPEFYDNDEPDKIGFRKVIYNWVNGSCNILG